MVGCGEGVVYLTSPALGRGGGGGGGGEGAVQLILAYSWERPAILVAGKGRGGVFISSVSSLSFQFIFLPCSSLSSLLFLLSIFSLALGDDTK